MSPPRSQLSAEEPPFASLAELREALRSDDDDRLQTAYEAVYDADLRPSEVQSSDPPVPNLVAGGVIPEGDPDGPPIGHRWDRIEELLEEIASNTGGS